MNKHSAVFRFYEELNDFLPPDQRKTAVTYRFTGRPGIKDAIEALGVPHTEVELIIVNGHSVRFDYRLRNGDRVAVYPMFESTDVTPLLRLREAPLRNSVFVLDVNLGKLARRLRMLGFDALYRNLLHRPGDRRYLGCDAPHNPHAGPAPAVSQKDHPRLLVARNRP